MINIRSNILPFCVTSVRSTVGIISDTFSCVTCIYSIWHQWVNCYWCTCDKHSKFHFQSLSRLSQYYSKEHKREFLTQINHVCITNQHLCYTCIGRNLSFKIKYVKHYVHVFSPCVCDSEGYDLIDLVVADLCLTCIING